MKKSQPILLLLLALALASCDLLGSNPDNPGEEVSPTKAQGPGGPAYLIGEIKDYVNRPKGVTNIDLFIMDTESYSDTILHVLINSENGSFQITDLPEAKVDMIFSGKDYLTAKIAKRNL